MTASLRPTIFYRILLQALSLMSGRRRRGSGSCRASSAQVGQILAPAADQASMLAALRRMTGRPSFPEKLSSMQIRAWSEIEVPGGKVGQTRPARLYRPRGRIGGVVLFLHGGGFVHCDLVSHHGICCRLAREAGAMVLSLDYRLAPENPFPAAIEDSWAALRWLGDVARMYGLPMAVAGDSAGGNIAAVIAQLARDEGGPELAAQLLFYPALSGIDEPETRQLYASGYLLTRRIMEWYARQYVADEAYLTHPLFAPASVERLDGLPPAMIVTAEFDPLRGDGEVYARKLDLAGVPVRLRQMRGAIHGFLNFYVLTRDGRRAIREGGEFLGRAFVKTARNAASFSSVK